MQVAKLFRLKAFIGTDFAQQPSGFEPIVLSWCEDGMVASEIQAELGMQASAVSHHLEKLKNEELVEVQREGTYLRYTANPEVLQDLLTFLFSQCCANTGVVQPESVFKVCQIEPAVARGQKKERT